MSIFAILRKSHRDVTHADLVDRFVSRELFELVVTAYADAGVVARHLRFGGRSKAELLSLCDILTVQLALQQPAREQPRPLRIEVVHVSPQAGLVEPVERHSSTAPSYSAVLVWITRGPEPETRCHTCPPLAGANW